MDLVVEEEKDVVQRQRADQVQEEPSSKATMVSEIVSQKALHANENIYII